MVGMTQFINLPKKVSYTIGNFYLLAYALITITLDWYANWENGESNESKGGEWRLK